MKQVTTGIKIDPLQNTIGTLSHYLTYGTLDEEAAENQEIKAISGADES
jgi:hypothetical protein